MKKQIILIFAFLLLFVVDASSRSILGADSTSRVAVKTGIEVLRDSGFAGLEGRRVGLVTNPSGVDRYLKSTIDILFEAPQVNLVALYGPEHGVRGDVYAGGKIADSKDTILACNQMSVS